ncbi:MAG TPA: plastocyanin/azurin family copper-binding protein [Solirubrobacteraceae bacterium]|nr:plastocyanin/azurin family copper-binding protein [Solirubrobacteraceae bacterium]
MRKPLLAVATLAATLLITASADSATKVTARLGDFYFKPEKLTVRSGTTVVWKWPSSAGDPHDVVLLRGPRGVRKFASEQASADFSYRRKLTVDGRYTIYCSLHPTQMRQSITVK